MSEREFREWQEYWQIEPFGQDIEDQRFARLMQLYAQRFTPKGKKPPGVGDFMLENYKVKKKPTLSVGAALKAMLGIKKND